MANHKPMKWHIYKVICCSVAYNSQMLDIIEMAVKINKDALCILYGKSSKVNYSSEKSKMQSKVYSMLSCAFEKWKRRTSLSCLYMLEIFLGEHTHTH